VQLAVHMPLNGEVWVSGCHINFKLIPGPHGTRTMHCLKRSFLHPCPPEPPFHLEGPPIDLHLSVITLGFSRSSRQPGGEPVDSLVSSLT